MDVFPAIAEVGDQISPVEDPDKDDGEDLCRICRSPEESGNPLRYPCACRGTIKYVHQDCLRLWLNRRGNKKCEVCGRSYSFVPLYAENAPERLPCNEFLIGVLLRVFGYMKLILPWILAIHFNTFCFCLHPWGQEITAHYQIDFGMSRKFAYLLAGLIYNVMVVSFLTIITCIKVEVEDYNARRRPGGFRADIFIGNGLGQGVIGGVVQVLWKYMNILCDWYDLKLIHFMGLPPRRIVVPLNPPLHEFGAIRRLFSFLDDNGFAVLAISVYVHILFVFLPFSIGWVVLLTVGGSDLPENSPIITGYMVMLSTSTAYFGILFTLYQVSYPAVVGWFSLGFHFIAVNLPCVLWKFSVKACNNRWWFPLGFQFIIVNLPCHLWNISVIICKNLFVLKDALVVCLKIGVLPWMIGWWLEICTYPFFGTTIPQIVEIHSIPWLVVYMRWSSGMICLVIADSNMNLIQEIIHRRAFWYLIDITDPDYKITELNLGYTNFVFATHWVLLVILFHLPIKAITLISPSFFPLKPWATNNKYDSFISAQAMYYKCQLIASGPRWLLKHTKPAIKLIVHNWIITVSSWLQLSDFLLVVPRREGFHRADQNVRPLIQPRRQFNNDNLWFKLYSIAEGSLVILHESQNDQDDMKDQRDNRFLLRIALMLVLAAFSLFLFSTAFMALPILVGRILFGSISSILLRFGVKHDDFCAFWMGCFILRAMYISTCSVYDHIHKGRINLLLKYVSIRIGNGLLLCIWFYVIPGLLGLLIDLMIIIPFRVPLDESPVYFLIQDWLIGVVVFHIWVILAFLTPNGWFATEAWREKLERFGNINIDTPPSMFVIRDVFGSIINTLLTTLCVPYLLVKSLLPLLGFSEGINSAIRRLIWPALLALITVWFMVKLTRDVIIYLHQLIFNERYLVGERVDNLTEGLEQGMISRGV